MTVEEQPPELAALYLATAVAVIVDAESLPAADAATRLGSPLHVITAWNPGDERPEQRVNREVNERLRADLLARTSSLWPALGSSSDGSHAEESWAVLGLTRGNALELGRKYRQIAIFEIHAGHQYVFACDGEWSVSREIHPTPAR